MTDDEAITMREIEIWRTAHLAQHEEHKEVHDRQHAENAKAIQLAFDSALERFKAHNKLHELARDSHDGEHERHMAFHAEQYNAMQIAIESARRTMEETAASHEKLHQAHSTAHDQQHVAHLQSHTEQEAATQMAINRAEATTRTAIERAEVTMRLTATEHEKLHLAHQASHADEQASTTKALDRAEATMRETAILHARAHEREHQMAQIAIDKAEHTSATRFEGLNQARDRSQDERNTFATRDQVEDKIAAVTARLDVLDRSAGVMLERLAIVAGNSARLDALEKHQAGDSGRDRGIALSWAVILGAAALAGTLGVLLARATGG